ncbi:MAG TPA: hypothetical protein DCO82_05510 [Alphaproteobacteria bacterium]|nr:hypothetical protein [Alphaproteobacteria bacterium]
MPDIVPSLIPAKPFGIADIHLLSSNVAEADYAAWSGATTYADGDRVIIVSPSATVTMTVANPAVVTWTAHGLPDNTPVRFTTTGSLPMGIIAGNVYFTREGLADANKFQVSERPDGPPIATAGTQSGTHTAFATRHDVYESLVGSNTGNAPARSPNHWVRVDSTNRWRMHDDSLGTQTANPDSIVNSYKPGRIADAVVLMNINAATVQATVTSASDGLVSDETFICVGPPSESSFYAWGFEPIARVTDMLIRDLPPYADATIALTLSDPGGTVLCGNCVIGKMRPVGLTQYGISSSIRDYSVKEESPFGPFTVKEGPYSRILEMTGYITSSASPSIFNLLAEYRATPVAIIGSSIYGQTIAFGFFASHKTIVQYLTRSLVQIEFEGLK